MGLGLCGLEMLFHECRRRGVRVVHLEVDRTNEPAKKLYEKFGFEETTRPLLSCRMKP